MRARTLNNERGTVMAVHRLGEPTSRDGDFSERVRVRIALGVTHDPQEACEIFREIKACEPDERKIIALASRDHLDKYSTCFEPGADQASEPPLVLIYAPGGISSGKWKSDDAPMEVFGKQLQSFESWMAPTLVSRMKAHLDHSALVIAVALYSPEEEQALCEILLRRAVDYIYVQDVPDLHS